MNIRAIALSVGALAAVAAILPLASYDSSQAATVITSGKENTSILVQNVGNAPAEFIADYFNPDGSPIAAATQIQSGVAPGSTRNFAQVFNDGLPIGYRGLAIISSDQPINTLLVRDILDAGNRKSYSIAGAYGGGGHTLSAPIAFNELLAGGSWNSRISVANTGSQVACLRMTYLVVVAGGGAATTNQTFTDNGTGGTGCATGYALPAGGQLTFGRTGTGVIQYPVSTQNNQMAVLIEVLGTPGDNAITANVDLYRSDGNRLFGTYNAFVVNNAAPSTDDVGSDIIVPLGIKDNSGYYSVIGVQVFDDAVTNLTFRYVGVNIHQNNAPIDVSVTVPNVSDVAVRSIYFEDSIPVGFVGYTRVTASGGANIAAVLVRAKQTAYFSGQNEALYTAVNGVPVDRAVNEWNLPLVFRWFSDGNYNSWIQVQVADGSTANVSLEFNGDPAQGCPVGPYNSTHSVTGSKVFYMLRDQASENGFGAVPPSCFFGGATITADKPIIVISNVTNNFYPNSDNDGLYNAFPVE